MATDLVNESDLGSQLRQLYAEAKEREFKSEPYYEPRLDSVIFHICPRRYYAVRYNKFLTVFLDAEDDALVGCEIKGVMTMLENTQGGLGVLVVDEDADVSILLVCALAQGPENKLQPLANYRELADALQDKKVHLGTAA